MGCRCLVALVALEAIGLGGGSALLGGDEGTHQPAAPGGAPGLCAAAGARGAGEDVLRTCEGAGQLPADEACAWGCSEGGGAHCAKLVPMGGALQSDDLKPNAALWPTTLAGPVAVNTDDGSIPGFRGPGRGID